MKSLQVAIDQTQSASSSSGAAGPAVVGLGFSDDVALCAWSALHAAFHEAGHFVVHHHLVPSDSPVEIAIFADGTGTYMPGEAHHGEKTRERVVAVYAGQAAELFLDPSCADAVPADARRDDVEASRLLDLLGEGERETHYRERARAEVAKHWGEIEIIAAILLDVDALRGDVASMILDLANGMDIKKAANRLDLPACAAMQIAATFSVRLAHEHVSQVLAVHGYRWSGIRPAA